MHEHEGWTVIRRPHRRASCSLVVAVCLGCAGCLIGNVGCLYRSKVERKDFRTPARFASKGAGTRAAAELAKPWWTVFGAAELDRLMVRAFADNLDLEVARARLEQSQAQLTSATAGWYPTITGNGEASRTQTVFNPQVIPLQGGTSLSSRAVRQNMFQLSVTAAYEVDLWGQVRYGRKAAWHGVAAAREQLRAAYVTLAANVADAYFLVVQQRALLKLLQQTIDNRQRQLEIVRRRYDAGVGRPADLYQAEQLLAQVQAQRAQVGGTLEVAEHALAILVGRFPGHIDSGTLDALPQAVQQPDLGVPGQLLLQRPDLRAAYHGVLAADARVGAAFAAYFPSIRLSATIGERFEPTGLIWSLIAGLTAPLFQGGKIYAQHLEQKAALRETIAAFRKTLLVAVGEVEDALARGRAAAEQMQWLERRVEASEGALRLSIDQYVQGLTGFLDVLTAEQALFTSRSDLIAAKRELVSARISLARALGGSWMDEHLLPASGRSARGNIRGSGSRSSRAVAIASRQER